MAEQLFEAFKFQPVGEPLRPMAFGVACECGQTIFVASGLALNVDVPEGMDLRAVCRCKREYSLAEQAAKVKEIRAQMKAEAEAEAKKAE